MDNKVMRSNDIRSAIDAQFSGVTKNLEMRQNVLRQVRGEIVVKKKLSVGLVLVIVLLLVTVTALAVTALSGYFNGYAHLENTHGEYSDGWPTSAKVELVRLMLDNGMAVDQEKTKELLDGSLTTEQQEMLATEIIEKYFAGTEYMDTYNIMQHELGAFDGWPYEQKALYSSLLVKYGHQKEDWPLYLTPEESDIQEEEAILRARKALNENYTEVESRLNSSKVATFFEQSKTEYGDDPVWIIEFNNPDAYRGIYRVILSRKGDVLTYNAPYTLPYSGNDSDLTEATFVEPGEYDVPKEKAIELAKSYLNEIGDYKSRMDNLTTQAYFLYNKRFCGGLEPVWLVYFYQGDVPLQKTLLGYDGSYIDTAPADKNFENTTHYDEGLSEPFDFVFYNMTVEEKAAFSEKWVPIMEEYIKTHPYISDRNASIFYKATRQVFGIPDEDHLSQEDAAAIGRKAIVDLGANELTLNQRKIGYSYDVTNPLQPLWVLVIYRSDNEPTTENSQTYEVKIDAKTGNIITTIMYKDENSFDGYYY